MRPIDVQGVISSSGLSPTTCRLLRWLLRSMFRAAVKNRLIAESPADDLAVPNGAPDDARALDAGEIGRLLDACDPWERSWVLLGLGTGVRISESLAVRLEKLDFLRRTLHVDDQARTLSAGPVELAPLKNRRPRAVPLTDELGKVLACHIDQHGTGDHGVVFPAPNGALMRRHIATERFGRIARRAELDGLTWHNLRDTAATAMLRDGLNPAAVAQIIGNTVPVLLKRYAAVMPEDVELARESLRRLMVGSAVLTA